MKPEEMKKGEWYYICYTKTDNFLIRSVPEKRGFKKLVKFIRYMGFGNFKFKVLNPSRKEKKYMRIMNEDTIWVPEKEFVRIRKPIGKEMEKIVESEI